MKQEHQAASLTRNRVLARNLLTRALGPLPRLLGAKVVTDKTFNGALVVLVDLEIPKGINVRLVTPDFHLLHVEEHKLALAEGVAEQAAREDDEVLLERLLEAGLRIGEVLLEQDALNEGNVVV